MTQTLDELRQQLAELRRDVLDELYDFERRLDRLEMAQQDQYAEVPDVIEDEPVAEAIMDMPEAVVEPVVEQPAAATWDNVEPPRSKSPSWLGMILQMLFSFLATPLSPLVHVSDALFRVYRHYQQQGKAAAFMMTAAGIMALLVGFGYVLQYSFYHWLGPWPKMLIAFAIANMVVFGAVKLHQKQPMLSDFASSLMGLGLVANYLCCYFLAGYYQLVPMGLMFVLLLGNSLLGYRLAHHFDARVIHVVCLLGGAFSPLLMPTLADAIVWYCAYVWVLFAITFWQAAQLHWPVLTRFTLLLSVVVLEYVMLDYTLGYHWLWLLHGFFYLALWVCCIEQGRFKSELSADGIVAVTLSLLAFLALLAQSQLDSVAMGVTLLLDVVLFSALFVWCKQLFSRQMQALCLLHVGVLTALAVMLLCHAAVAQPLLMLEVVLLLQLGCRYQLPALRKEALLLGGYVLVQVVQHWWIDWQYWPELALGSALLNATLLCAMCAVAAYLGHLNRHLLSHWENAVVRIMSGFAICWASLLIVYLCAIGLQSYALLLCPLLAFGMIWLTKQLRIGFVEYWAWLMLLVPLALLIDGIYEAESVRFSAQSLLAKLARLEVLAGLWACCFVYQRYYPESRFAPLAAVGRILFYMLLSVCWLSSVFRYYPEWFAVAMWLSTAMAYLFSLWIGHAWLRYQTVLLALVSILISFVFAALDWIGLLDNWGSVAVLLGGVLFVLVNLQRRRAAFTDQLTHSCLRSVLVMGHYYWGFMCSAILFYLTEQPACLLWGLAMYLLCHAMTWPRLTLLRRHLYSFLGLAMLATLLLWLTLAKNEAHWLLWPALMVSLIVTWFVLLHRLQYTVWPRSHGRFNRFLYWFCNGVLLAGYSVLLQSVLPAEGTLLNTLALVSHATVLLLLTLKPRLTFLQYQSWLLFAIAAVKLFMFDLAGFALLQKMLVFILLGFVLLLGAYVFQRLKQTA